MGHYLSEPRTDKQIDKGASDGTDLALRYCAASMQGWRRTMEDTCYVNASLPQGEAVFCVFDGHGGREIAAFCRMEFERTFTALEAYQARNYEQALRDCFVRLDELLTTIEGQNQVVEISNQIQQEMRESDQAQFSGGDASDETLRKIPQNVGTTACVILVTKTDIFCANAGDSRAVLAQGVQSFDLSDDHKPENEDELIRIEGAGGTVEDGRINGKLSLSRAIGDMAYKQNPSLSVDRQAITCVPDVTRRARSPEDSYILIACDGIWECGSSHEIVELVNELVEQRTNEQ